MFKQIRQQNAYKDRIEEVIYLKSYNSIIVRYDTKTKQLVLGEDWNYSNTTRKHLYEFFRDNNINIPHSNKDIREMIKNGDIGLKSNREMIDIWWDDSKPSIYVKEK